MPSAKKSAFATPESKNLVALASNKPEAESNNSLEFKVIELSERDTFVLVPENAGCSLTVVILLKLSVLTTLEITDVAFELKFPSLSTALIKYVPTLAGTVIEVAGLETFETRFTEFSHSAVPSVFS